jgi:hypothetical protein
MFDISTSVFTSFNLAHLVLDGQLSLDLSLVLAGIVEDTLLGWVGEEAIVEDIVEVG